MNPVPAPIQFDVASTLNEFLTILLTLFGHPAWQPVVGLMVLFAIVKFSVTLIRRLSS